VPIPASAAIATFYSPAQDFVQVLRPDAYFEPINRHRTALHEFGHYAAARIMPHGAD
jgi:antirestriction protein ArdC